MTATVLVSAPRLAQAGVETLAAAGARVLYVGTTDPVAEMLRLMREEPIDAVISRTLRLTAEMIEACPSLKVISRHGVGYDNVDIAAATRRSIPVTVAGATNARSVAELALGLTLAAARRIAAGDRAIRAGAWPRAAAGMQLGGRTLGLVGCGRIARHLADMATALGMRVVAFDPGAPALPDGIARADTLEALLAASDVVSLHCPLTASTRHFIDAAAIRRMRSGAILVNTARGGLVDETALAEALSQGHLAGAGLDTLETEPPAPDHPLLHLEAAVLSPHVGGTTDAALAETARAAAQNALDVLSGRPIDPQLVVNCEALGFAAKEPAE